MMPLPLNKMQPKSAQPLAKKVIAAFVQQKTPACLQQKPNTPPLPSSEPMQNVATSPEWQLQEAGAIANPSAPLQLKKHAIHIPPNENTMQPPNFRSAMAHFPPKLNTAFKDILHGEVVGIWPIRPDHLQ